MSRYSLHALSWEPKELPKVEIPPFPDVEILYVYGLCQNIIDQSWLEENPKRRLILLEDDTGLLAEALRTFPEQPQVELEWLQSISSLAERYPSEKVEVIGTRKMPRNLRLSLLRKTVLSVGYLTDRVQGYALFSHFVQNIPHLKNAFYANRLRFQDIPVIVCGAGPSLEPKLLKTLEKKAIIIAGGSAIPALITAGVVPHFGIAIDPNFEEYHRLKNCGAVNMPLLFPMRLHPAVFPTLKGPFGYIRSGMGGAAELLLDETLGLTEPLLGRGISAEAMSVTAICVAFAREIGAKTILLNGVDLAYTGGVHYAGGVIQENTVRGEKGLCDRHLTSKDKKGNKVLTALRWLMEAKSLGQYAKKNKQIRWINTTAGGLHIPGMEEMPLSKVPFNREWDLRALIAEQIAAHPLPKLEKDLVQELRDSLTRLIVHLEILAGEKPGLKPIAEYELKDELAAAIFFYDVWKVLGKDNWKSFLEMARAYLRMSTLPVSR